MSPPRRRRSPLRRDRGAGRRDDRGHQLVGGRPRKTQEELDKEMEEYWVSKDINGTKPDDDSRAEKGRVANPNHDEDVDMIT